MSRALSEGVLEAFCKYAEDTEVPSTFALWSGMSMVSAALGRNCFIDFSFFTIYPNMYIVLVAKSGRCRKSSSIELALYFMQKVKPKIKILAQKMTTEALISALCGTNVKDSNIIALDAVGAIVADELITFIDRNAFQSGMVTTLTKLWDCTDYEYETKSRGKEILHNPCLSIHGGVTLHGIKEAIPQAAIGGGFTSRVVFVYLENREKDVFWPKLTPENQVRAEGIEHDMNEIAKMRGGFGLSTEAYKILEAEYSRFNKESPLFDIAHLAGYADRRHTNLLKVGMVVSASRRDSRIITEQDAGTAIQALAAIEGDMPKVLSVIDREFVGEVAEQTLQIIMKRGTIGRPELVKLMSNYLSSRQLDIVLETLHETKVIRTDNVNGRKITYTFIGKKK